MTLVFTAFSLGLIFNAAPGPVFAETIRRGIGGGFRQAFAVQIGSLTGDALWAVLGLAGVGFLLQLDSLRTPIGIAGMLYLLWLAWESWRASAQEFNLNSMTDSAEHGNALRSGMILSLTNPQNIAYWASMGSALGALGIHNPTISDYTGFFAGFMLASLAWTFLCARLVGYIFGGAGPRWARITYRACAVAFLILALLSLRAVIAPGIS
jgi:chemosensory pili system protein ChpE